MVRLLHALCGSTIPGDIVSSGNTLFVHFYSNSYGTYSGFQIHYTTVEGISAKRTLCFAKGEIIFIFLKGNTLDLTVFRALFWAGSFKK